MADADDNLVQMIAREVINVLRERGQLEALRSSDGAPSPAASPAEVRPPIGTCTGDDSKFPELHVREDAPAPGSPGANGVAETPIAPADPGAAAPVTPGTPDAPDAPQAPDNRIPLTGIVTANQLQDAMNASPDGVVLLAPDARLSPLGNDLARQFPERVRRASPVGGNPARAGEAADLPWLWWLDGHSDVVNRLTAARGRVIRPMTTVGRAGALTQVVRELAEQLKRKRIAGGVLFVPSAAVAMAYANRCASIRAVVGTGEQTLDEGVGQLGANVLIIEYPHHGERPMAAMVDRMLEQTPKASPQIQRDLADLHRCG